MATFSSSFLEANMFIAGSHSLIKSTTYKVVLPFYGYAALSFLLATMLMLLDTSAFTGHFFHPQLLAITHIMALGWGTMIILGASHQLFPVLIEGKLYSNALAYLSFLFAAIGIPLLIYGFYVFNLGAIAQAGGVLINLSVVCYVTNIMMSISKSKQENVHAIFAFTAAMWLLLTTLLGLLLLYNFTHHLLPRDSLYYLSMHAHLGIIGWFLLTIMGVGSRLIPMFLISKYENKRLLWWIFGLINFGLIAFVVLFFIGSERYLYPIASVGFGIVLFGFYNYQAYKNRIRKKVDAQLKTSLLSVASMAIPVIVLIGIIISFTSQNNVKLVVLYGFTIFFGWITAIILGMTFKTLPFIIWNKVYHNIAGLGKTPNPKDLFNNTLYRLSGIFYIFGFLVFGGGIVWSHVIFLKTGAVLLLITALLYNFNVFKILFHKAK